MEKLPETSREDPEKSAAAPDPGGVRRKTDPQQVQVRIDDSKAVSAYANFCRVSGTPEELIIDFGLNMQPVGVPSEPIPITQRIITNFYTAKRLLHTLHLSIQQHEAHFGVLETDVRKRIKPGATGQPPANA